MAAVSSIILGTVAAASVASAGMAYASGEEQKKQAKKAEQAARAAQAEQSALALQDKKAADLALKNQQSKMVKGTSGRSGILFGTELGTEDEKKQTLGA